MIMIICLRLDVWNMIRVTQNLPENMSGIRPQHNIWSCTILHVNTLVMVKFEEKKHHSSLINSPI